MPKKRLKTISKRMTTKSVTKIRKKVREHKRKMAKLAKHGLAKKGPRIGKIESKIPSMMPFKDDVLKTAEKQVEIRNEEKRRYYDLHLARKAEKIEEKNIRKNMTRKERMDLLLEEVSQFGGPQLPPAERPSLAERMKKKDKAMDTAIRDNVKAYYKDFREVVKASDIILQVLDARDPMGSRCAELEDYILESGPSKRLVLLLNKIDLIPRDNLLEWLKYLRSEYPAMPFKASTQVQRKNLKQQKGKIENLPAKATNIRGCLGSEKLMQLFANYCRNKDIKSKITVGVVGFPNTGKSSVINSLKRSKSCGIGSIPGITKTVQRVYMDRRTWLLDSPGIVLTRDMTSVSAVLHNCVNVNNIDDPVPPVEAILKRCNKDQMMLRYNIPNYTDTRHFLQLIAKRYGYTQRGGVPDVLRAGKQILQEWNVGRIRYFTHPPKRTVDPNHERAEIVQSLSKPFDLDSLLKDEETQLSSLWGDKAIKDDIPVVADMLTSQAEATRTQDVTMGDNKTQSAENMDVDTKTMTVEFPATKRTRKEKESKVDTDSLLAGNQQSNKQVKKAYKKMKKEKKRADVVSTFLSDALNSALPSTKHVSTPLIKPAVLRSSVVPAVRPAVVPAVPAAAQADDSYDFNELYNA